MSLSVSAVMTCFNHAAFVRQAVESILDQSYPASEVIVVDDGSTDGSLDVLESFGDRVRVLVHDGHANRGSAPSMNLALTVARGEVIAFLESDDYWYREKLEKQIQVLVAQPDVGLVYTNGRAVDRLGRPLHPLFVTGFKEANSAERLLVDCYISAGMSTVAVRRALLDAVGGLDVSIPYAKDHDLWLRLIEITRFAYIPELLMAYRKHHGQQSADRKHWDDGFAVVRMALRRHPYKGRAVRRRLAVLNYRLAEYHWSQRAMLRAAGRASCSAVLDPLRAARECIRILLRREGEVRGESQ